MGRRPFNRVCAINYPSRIEGWLDVCETEGELTRKHKALPWSPLYCVLQQDEQSFTAYCSEEISLTDVLFNEYPRVRLDRVRRPAKVLWDGPPTLREEPEDSDTCPMDIALNTTLYSDLGEYKSKTLPRIHFDTSVNDTSMHEGNPYCLNIKA